MGKQTEYDQWQIFEDDIGNKGWYANKIPDIKHTQTSDDSSAPTEEINLKHVALSLLSLATAISLSSSTIPVSPQEIKEAINPSEPSIEEPEKVVILPEREQTVLAGELDPVSILYPEQLPKHRINSFKDIKAVPELISYTENEYDPARQKFASDAVYLPVKILEIGQPLPEMSSPPGVGIPYKVTADYAGTSLVFYIRGEIAHEYFQRLKDLSVPPDSKWGDNIVPLTFIPLIDVIVADSLLSSQAKQALNNYGIGLFRSIFTSPVFNYDDPVTLDILKNLNYQAINDGLYISYPDSNRPGIFSLMELILPLKADFKYNSTLAFDRVSQEFYDNFSGNNYSSLRNHNHPYWKLHLKDGAIMYLDYKNLPTHINGNLMQFLRSGEAGNIAFSNIDSFALTLTPVAEVIAANGTGQTVKSGSTVYKVDAVPALVNPAGRSKSKIIVWGQSSSRQTHKKWE